MIFKKDGKKIIEFKTDVKGLETVAPVKPSSYFIPQWFKDLPFDEEGMEQAVLDKKIQNVLGVLGWDLSRANDSEVMDNFFEF